MTVSPGRGVVILGGGMAGLATAWELSHPGWQSRFGSITVYERSGRLGGKGASSRGAHGRIEEHGLHVLLGYYHATFNIMRRCYDELDRPSTDPASPIPTWRAAVVPCNRIGVMERQQDGWLPWLAEFPSDDRMPGDSIPSYEGVLNLPPDILSRAVRLLAQLWRSLGPERPAPGLHIGRPPADADPTASLATTLIAGTVATFAFTLSRLEELVVEFPPGAARKREFGRLLGLTRDGLEQTVTSSAAGSRAWQVVDFVLSNVQGIVTDDLLVDKAAVAAANDLDYRDWLRHHGASERTLRSPLVRGLYDLVFAYQHGDRARPRFAAGVGVQLGMQLFCGYEGSIFWMMRAGMGETVFAPLYQVLRARGVEFRFHHELTDVVVDDDGRRIREVHLSVDARGAAVREPLETIGGLPCWRADDHASTGSTSSRDHLVLSVGVDFDVAVLAVPPPALAHAAPTLLARSPQWANLVARVGSVCTQALQLWMRESETELGWSHQAGTVVSGFGERFDTWASMSHLLAVEEWPGHDAPRSIAYFCGALPDVLVHDDDPPAVVRRAAGSFVEGDLPKLWPAARDGLDGFRWSAICTGDGRRADTSTALDTQYWRANSAGSDRYVQSLPGTDADRISPSGTGVDGMYAAGDWTNCGLNAGCIEAAARAGLEAASAIIARCSP